MTGTTPGGGAPAQMGQGRDGDHGLVGVFCGTSILLHNDEEIFDYYDNPEKYHEKRDQLLRIL